MSWTVRHGTCAPSSTRSPTTGLRRPASSVCRVFVAFPVILTDSVSNMTLSGGLVSQILLEMQPTTPHSLVVHLVTWLSGRGNAGKTLPFACHSWGVLRRHSTGSSDRCRDFNDIWAGGGLQNPGSAAEGTGQQPALSLRSALRCEAAQPIFLAGTIGVVHDAVRPKFCHGKTVSVVVPRPETLSKRACHTPSSSV